MFINNFNNITKTKRTNRGSSMTVRSSVQTQGSSRLLSFWSNSKKHPTGSHTQAALLRNSTYFIKQKKTQLTMSLGPIAKKKKSMITLGFKSKTYSISSSLFHVKPFVKLQNSNVLNTPLGFNGRVVSQSVIRTVRYVLLV